MLRSESQSALDEVIICCQELSDHYRQAAEMIADADLAALFKALAERRQAAAEKLIEHSRELGDLPRISDPDKVTVDELFIRLKALVAPDSCSTLLQEREQAEQQLAQRIADALETDLPAAIQHTLRELLTEAQGAQVQLATAQRAG